MRSELVGKTIAAVEVLQTKSLNLPPDAFVPNLIEQFLGSWFRWRSSRRSRHIAGMVLQWLRAKQPCSFS